VFKKVLVATDSSENAQTAAEYASKLLKYHPEAQVVLLNVYKIPNIREYDAHVSIENTLRQRSQGILDEAAGVFDTQDISVEKVSLPGDPGQVIAEYARENGFDHIIIGATGQSQLGALLFGSVARKVIQLARCPVIVIR